MVELAGIGPGPYTCMLLADAGADVLRVDRATGSPPAPSAGPHWDLLNRSRRSVAVDLKHAEGVATRPRPRGPGRRARRGLAARCGRAPGHRARAVPGAQSPARLRAHDRVGPGRAAGVGGRARHQLHRPGRGPVAHRPGRGATGAAAQPGRRLRRWRDAARLRHVRGHAGGAALGPGPGRRRGHGRRGRLAHDHDLRLPPARDVDRGPGRERPRHRRARSTRSTTPATASGSRSAPSSPSSTPSCSRSSGSTAKSSPPRTTGSSGPP